MQWLRNKVGEFIRRTVKSDGGNILVFGGIFLFVLIAAGGLAVDYSRATGLYQKLNQAAEIAVREAVRGKSDPEVRELVYGQVDAYMRSMGYASPRDNVVININRDSGGVVNLSVQADYKGLFRAFYSSASQQLDVGASASARELCSAQAPADETQWLGSAEACPAGQVGTISFEYEQVRQHVCLSETSAPVWNAWADTGKHRNEVNTCHTECVAPDPEYTWSNSEQVACPATQVGSVWLEREQVRYASCPVGATAPVWGSWSATGKVQEVSNSCITPPPSCVVPPSESRWDDQTGICPAGTTGSISWQAEMGRTATCPASTGSPVWGAWSATGNQRDNVNTCSAPPSDVVWPTPGTYQWTVPAGVNEISAVAIGGGGGVTMAGTASTIFRGPAKLLTAEGGDDAVTATVDLKDSGTNYAVHYGGRGGDGVNRPASSQQAAGGGGGAGSYVNTPTAGRGANQISSYKSWPTIYIFQGTRSAGGGSGGSTQTAGTPPAGYADGYLGAFTYGVVQGGGGTGLYGYWTAPNPPPGGRGGQTVRDNSGPFGTAGAVIRDGVYGGQVGGDFGGGAAAGGYLKGGRGGELAWKNKIPVTPGETLSIVVGAPGFNCTNPCTTANTAYGGKGGVRILWGAGRSFPFTNVFSSSN
ncbi:hypothetical protein V5F40_22645 [Xanthobacter sp. DSM 14520]|uniref:TadE/TadG family type IV pilus assembly protein n=1 Tax=Xanthobacter autotrophicus (strain ATCC BAA-1158 / Py2) TaxID=78245 RepID=UPI00372A8701